MIDITDREFIRLSSYIKSNFGIDLREKRVLVEGRLSNLIIEKGYERFGDYIDGIFSDTTGTEVQTLLNKVTTNHTFFMRESVHFDFFRKVVLPYLEENVYDKDIRIWSAGCSSGEEPYTLAMIMSEYFGDRINLWDTQILATDISEKALEKAKEGIYNKEAIENMPPEFRMKYFIKKANSTYEVVDEIKSKVIFREFNLMENIFPFKKKFHVIFCRNVMIYFDQDTKVELVNKFYNSTEKNGYFFIGHSEFINKEDTKYQNVIPAVYRKI